MSILPQTVYAMKIQFSLININPTLYDNRNSHIKYFVSIYVQSKSEE